MYGLREIDDAFVDWMYCNKEITGCRLSEYSERGFVLGIDIGRPNADTFKQDIVDAENTWKNYFGKEPFDIIHAVRVW